MSLEEDWKEYPALRRYAFNNVSELDEHLRKCHKTLMSQDGMAYGYLYQKQTERAVRLKKELEECQQTINKLQEIITKENINIGTL